MDGTHSSHIKEEPTTTTTNTYASKPVHRNLASSGKTNMGNSSSDDGDENSLFKSQKLLLNSSFPSPRQHVNDAKGKEASSMNGRERLKRHREEVAGQVMIPETWGRENFLEDWIDYSSFDKLLAPNGIASARESLMAEARRRASSQRLRIKSRC